MSPTITASSGTTRSRRCSRCASSISSSSRSNSRRWCKCPAITSTTKRKARSRSATSSRPLLPARPSANRAPCRPDVADLDRAFRFVVLVIAGHLHHLLELLRLLLDIDDAQREHLLLRVVPDEAVIVGDIEDRHPPIRFGQFGFHLGLHGHHVRRALARGRDLDGERESPAFSDLPHGGGEVPERLAQFGDGHSLVDLENGLGEHGYSLSSVTRSAKPCAKARISSALAISSGDSLRTNFTAALPYTLPCGFCAFSSSKRRMQWWYWMPCVTSRTKNWRTALRLVGGIDSTSGSREEPCAMSNWRDSLQAWASPALPHLASGHLAHSPPGVPWPVLPSRDEQSGGTLPASFDW